MDVKCHSHSIISTKKVTKDVLRKNHRKQICKQLPVLWMSNIIAIAKTKQQPLLRLFYVRTQKTNMQTTSVLGISNVIFIAKKKIAVTKDVLRKNVENKYANNFRIRDIKRHIYSKKEKQPLLRMSYVRTQKTNMQTTSVLGISNVIFIAKKKNSRY